MKSSSQCSEVSRKAASLWLLFVSLYVFLHPTHVAGQISSPEIRCVAVDSVGDVTLTWDTAHTNINNTFVAYKIRSATNPSGPYSPIGAPIFGSGQMSATFPTSANANIVYFVIYDTTLSGTTLPLDTVSTMFLTVIPGGGLASLTWNPIRRTPLPTASPWYNIYREYPNHIWEFIGSTKALQYLDTITVCYDSLGYKIENADSSGCNSVSKSARNLFSDLLGPPPVYLDTVSVTSANTVDITWEVNRYQDVTKYIIYELINTIYKPIDTVIGRNSTFFNYLNGNNPDSATLSFRVAAVDSCGRVGPQSITQTTIYLTQQPNPCAQTNTLSWNSYEHLIPAIGQYSVAKYEVFASVNNGSFNLIGTTPSGVTTFIDSNLSRAETIRYYVRVVDSSRADTTASSNIIYDTVKAARLPRYFYLNDASVVNNSTEVSVECYVDTFSGLKNYEFFRAYDSSSTYTPIGTVSAPLHQSFVSIIDTSNPDRESYSYKVVGLDSCNNKVDTSNLGQTIFLTAVGQSTEINYLQWNSYEQWAGGVNQYLVYRSLDGVNYTAIGATGGAGPYNFQDNVTNIVTGYGFFYYYVQAIESSSHYPFIDTSNSNIAIAYQDPRVFIPDAFNPNGKNRVFYPVGTFVNVTGYDFSIFNRWGELIFETNDPEEGWNGTYKGKKVAEGVYVYLLTYTSSKGEYFQDKGTVTLLK